MKKGFTLIELLVVISIIGILASLTFVSYSGAQKQTRDTQRRSDLAQYRNGLENYAASNEGMYPSYTSAGAVTGDLCSVLKPDFISDCPDDPTEGEDYYYQSDGPNDGLASATKYILYADLETATLWYVCSSGVSDKTAEETAPTIDTCP